jgi:hypothetical protein
MVIALALIGLAVLVPLFGADSRDGLDWAPGNFWLRRRFGPDRFRSSDSPGRGGGGRVSADQCRSLPVAG